ncbi:MAG: aromatic ring-hydroxylating dioxygenase subunit alpha [Myxococcales bacterium]|nr:aromatic ring-hydroxylating dioxygenase subunit alpha [Myxococcales bacterium]
MSEPASKLLPVLSRGNTSAARVADDWYIACAARDLRTTPRALTVLGWPMALFRDAEGGRAGALLDRCPHRNVPLSGGKVVGPNLECPYHGWQFAADGACKRVPGLDGPSEANGRRVPAFATRELDGYIWVYCEPDAEPKREPFRFPHLGERGWHAVHDVVEAEGTLHAVAENALDVPHTSFLHGGLFRKDGDRQPIEVIVRRWHDRVEAQYIGEARPEGLVGRLLAPGGGEVEHFDRFILPGIVQVEYRLGERSHLLVSTALTPIDDFRTRLYAVVTFKLPLPHWLVALVVRPIARHIFRQDARMLARQTEVIRKFGGEQFQSTEIDTLGPGILRLLRNAERGERTPLDAPVEKRLTMLV